MLAAARSKAGWGQAGATHPCPASWHLVFLFRSSAMEKGKLQRAGKDSSKRGRQVSLGHWERQGGS